MWQVFYSVSLFVHALVAGMKKFEYMGKQWHETCFCCHECRQPISSKSFIPRDEHVICITCYEQQYAQRCTKCNGVSYKVDYPKIYQQIYIKFDGAVYQNTGKKWLDFRNNLVRPFLPISELAYRFFSF